MSREREIRGRLEELRKETGHLLYGPVARAYVQDVEALLSIIDEQRAEIERLKIPKGGYEEMCARLTRSLDECAAKNRHLLSIIDEQRRALERLRARVDALQGRNRIWNANANRLDWTEESGRDRKGEG